MGLLITGNDPDGDLHEYTIILTFDDIPNGIIEESSAQTYDLPGSVDGGVLCKTNAVDITLNVTVDGTVLEPGVTYDWGVVLADASGRESEQVLQTCATPG